MKRPLLIVPCKESPYYLIDVLGPFSVTCNHGIFSKVKFTDPPSAGKNSEKNHENTSIIWLLTGI